MMMIKKVIIFKKNTMKYANDNDQESDNIHEEYDEVCKEIDDNHPTNQIDEGLKLQCDDLDRLGSAVGELAIQVFLLFSSIFKEGQ